MTENSDGNSIYVLNDIRVQSPEDLYIEGLATIIANNPVNGKKAGGSAILVNKTWTVKEIEQPHKESLILEISPPNSHPFILSTMYNKPGKLVPKSFVDAVEKASKEKAVLLTGDFNSACSEFGSRTETREGKHLLDLISNSSLIYVDNAEPTYVSDSTGQWNLLDYGFINQRMAARLTNFKVETEIGSDHLPLHFEISGQLLPQRRLVESIDWTEVNEAISNSPAVQEAVDEVETEWQKIKEKHFDMSKVDELIGKLTLGLAEAKASVTRQKVKTTRINSFPIAPDTRQAIKAKRNAHKVLNKNKHRTDTEEIRLKVKEADKTLKSLLKRDKIADFENKIGDINNERNNTKKWKKMKSIMRLGNPDNSPISHLTKPDGSSTNSLKEIVDVHIERLHETHRPKEADPEMGEWEESLNSEIQSNYSLFHPLDNVLEEEGDEEIKDFFTIEKLKKKIEKLKTKSAPGEDGVGNNLLQNLPDKVVEALFKIFNICIAGGYFPTRWKRARIKMILKPGRDKKLSQNYRPISLLSNTAKLFESLIKDALDHFVDKQNLIPQIHSGFRKGRSTQENFIRLSESIARGFKRNQPTIGAFIDLERAFDGLHHDSIRVKIAASNLPPKIIRIISSFLRNRIIYVQENETKSKEMPMLGGAPQGAILSPPIFTLFTADAPLRIDEEEGAALFADDTSCWATCDSLELSIMMLQRRLRLLETWGRKWRLVPAPGKSHIVCFSRRKRIRDLAKTYTISLMGKQVGWVEEAKFLGTYYDSQLSFRQHIEKLINKSTAKAQSICRLTKFGKLRNPDLIIHLFNSLIMSTFTYSSPAYVGMSELIWSKVDSFFSKSLKCAFGIPIKTSNLAVLEFYYGNRVSNIIKDITGKRIHDIAASVPIVADIIPQIADTLFHKPNCSPIEKLIAHSNCRSFGDCLMCFVGVPHHCVKRR